MIFGSQPKPVAITWSRKLNSGIQDRLRLMILTSFATSNATEHLWLSFLT